MSQSPQAWLNENAINLGFCEKLNAKMSKEACAKVKEAALGTTESWGPRRPRKTVKKWKDIRDYETYIPCRDCEGVKMEKDKDTASVKTCAHEGCNRPVYEKRSADLCMEHWRADHTAQIRLTRKKNKMISTTVARQTRHGERAETISAVCAPNILDRKIVKMLAPDLMMPGMRPLKRKLSLLLSDLMIQRLALIQQKNQLAGRQLARTDIIRLMIMEASEIVIAEWRARRQVSDEEMEAAGLDLARDRK